MAELSVTAVRALLERCRNAGLLVRTDGDLLRLSSPTGPPPAALFADLREAKPDVLAYLRDARTAHVHPCSACGSFFFPEPAVTCYRCRKRRSEAPIGPPCDGCGEACERCQGSPRPEVEHG